MKKIGGLIEGLIVLVLGLAMCALVKADNYWMYLHPKFKWLTLTAGIVLILAGAITVLYNRRPSLIRISIFLAFGTIAIMGYSLPNLTSTVASGPLVETSTEKESRLILKNLEYTKINLGELYMISGGEVDEKTTGLYVARGIVKRSPKLDELAEFVLFRVFMWCCFADAVAVGIRVKYDEQLEELRDGQWVRVYGKLQQLPSGLSRPKVQVKGIISKALSRFHGLAAVKVEEIDPPAIPYMFEFRETEPYAY
jgi:uncharacterized repeat protein (TIGR03943 family)